jgi:hypothetical protein
MHRAGARRPEDQAGSRLIDAQDQDNWSGSLESELPDPFKKPALKKGFILKGSSFQKELEPRTKSLQVLSAPPVCQVGIFDSLSPSWLQNRLTTLQWQVPLSHSSWVHRALFLSFWLSSHIPSSLSKGVIGSGEWQTCSWSNQLGARGSESRV